MRLGAGARSTQDPHRPEAQGGLADVGWLVAALVALVVVGVLAVAAPGIFGPAFAGLAPLIVVIAVIGLGAVWWRRSRGRIDADTAEPRRATDAGGSKLAEDERVET
jgi:Tfp pilus assembly protein PilX